MRDEDKTKAQLINELADLRQQTAHFNKTGTKYKSHKESTITAEERLQALFENTIVGIYQSSPEGRYITVNPAFARIFGYDSPGELLSSVTNIGKQLYVKTDDRDKRIEQVLKNGIGDFEVHIYRKDRSKAWIENHVRVVRDDNGDITCFEGMAVDITQRKQAEEELHKYRDHLEEMVEKRTVQLRTALEELQQEEEVLRQSEERFFKAFNASPAAMSIQLMSDYTLIDVNKGFTDITGYTREEVIGKTPTDLGLIINREDISKVLQVKGLETVHNIEVKMRRKTGEERISLFSAVLININNEPCILCMAHDITELMQFQKEMARLDRLNLVGELAAGIGHEVRNPMTTVKGFLQLLREKEKYLQEREIFDLMIDEIDRANSIITEFLSLAKNKAVDLRRRSLNKIIKSLYPLIQADALKSDNYIALELEDIPMLLLDEREIRQVILNLVRNGLEAMQSGGILIIRTIKEEGEVILSVQDQGTGIKQEVLEKLGTPFFTTKDNGSGLGLAVCYSIAARNNARIDIETGSEGTTIFVRLKRPDGSSLSA